jgi:hypothetical protein
MLTIAAVVSEIHPPLALGIAGHDGAVGLEDRLVRRMSNKSPIAGGVDSKRVTGDDFAAVACRQSPDRGKCCRGLDEPDRAVHEEKIGPTEPSRRKRQTTCLMCRLVDVRIHLREKSLMGLGRSDGEAQQGTGFWLAGQA